MKNRIKYMQFKDRNYIVFRYWKYTHNHSPSTIVINVQDVIKIVAIFYRAFIRKTITKVICEIQ